MTEESLFLAALEKSESAERRSFLDEACGLDADLRRRVEALLVAYDAGEGRLEPASHDPAETGEYTPQPQELPVTRDYHTQAEPGTVIAGRYTLVERIGEGGMGEVWVAKQTEPVKRKVALKLIKAGMDSKAVLARFEQERQALAMMDHPNIARVLDGGTTGYDREDREVQPAAPARDGGEALAGAAGWSGSGRPFFVMELVNGLPLTKFCDEARLTPNERLELFVPICQAVQHAHQKAVVHRDLKPSNILVTLIDGKPVPKVIDFGVAKAIGGKLIDESLSTQFGAVVGTLEYMSPEQAGFSGVDIDTRADIYSLGVILYELLTGLRPIDAKRLKQAAYTEMIRIIQEEEPSKPSTRLSTDESLPSLAALRQTEPKKLMALLRGELDWVVMRCLEKSRERRYETANALNRDIQRYLADEPVEARPPTAFYRLGKFLRRNKRPALAAALVLLAILAGIVGTTLGLIEAKRQERTARAEADDKEKAWKKEATARKAAENAKRDMYSFSEFLVQDIIATARPKGVHGGLGIDVTVREAVDEAVKHIEKRFADRPRAHARARLAVGRTYLNVDEPRQAIDHLGRALALYEQELGADNVETLFCRSELARAYFAAKDMEHSLREHQEVLRRRQKTLGAYHPHTLVSMNNVAWGYMRTKRIEQAVALFEKTLELFKKRQGLDYYDTLVCMNSLAIAYQATDRLEEATVILNELIPRLKKVLGADASLTLNATNSLAAVYTKTKRFADAVPLFEEVIAKTEELFGPTNSRTLATISNLAIVHERQKDYAKAEKLWLVVVTRSRPSGVTYHRSLGQLLANLGSCRLKLGRFGDAETVLRESLTIREKKQPDAWSTFDTKSLIGAALFGQKKYADAEPLLLEGFNGMKQRADKMPKASRIRLRNSADRLIQLFKATNRPNELTRWQAEKAKLLATTSMNQKRK